MEPCGDVTALYPVCGGSYIKLHMRQNYTQLHTHTHTHTQSAYIIV